MDTIDNNLTNGCDDISKKYCNSYNKLVVMLDKILSGGEDLLQQWDLSSLGLYLCKCVEQEANSSVIQLMRKKLGIKMPKFYCRVDRQFPRELARVDTGKGYYSHFVNLNDAEPGNKSALKLIPLGDAFHVMETLVDAEDGDWFDDYPCLRDPRFREIWRYIIIIRNQIAHAGRIIQRDDFLNCFRDCKEFLEKYMPELAEMKAELAPKGWKGVGACLSGHDNGASLEKKPWAVETFHENALPLPTIEDWYHRDALHKYVDLLFKEGKDLEACAVGDEMIKFERQFNWLDIPFKEGEHYGLKDFKGEVVVPARYDDFANLYSYLSPFTIDVSVVVKNGKMGLVRRYTGEELTPIIYDAIEHKQGTPFFYYQKDGVKAAGLLDNDGKEIIPNIIDWADTWWNPAGFMFMSGDKYGYYSIEYDFCVPPIYDDIQILDLEVPIIFVIDGQEGSISQDGVFYTTEELKQLEEEDYAAYERLELLREFEG